jgi:hypothetical protein
VCGLQVLDDFIDNPRSIINLLASSLPQQSGFFINYLLIAGTKDPNTTRGQEELIVNHHFVHFFPGFGRLPLKLFRLPALVQRIFTIILCKPVTEREVRTQVLFCWFLIVDC